ncbi:TPA: serine protease [Candidatus Scatousia excrementigallinarum]|uniref:Serine protease n=1 Tax=Candidatus Scatousia excrementigallinarum TaxID=2840935 RepID=A0A9D1EWS2_9BACT|nr:serine protease [Candidatus Scatousia excrementigallinarum]
MIKRIIYVFVSILIGFSVNICRAENNSSSLYYSNVDSILLVETQNNSGSGVILKDDGTFVTCFHVISDADYIKVTTKNGSKYYVNGFRYINPLTDIAVLKINSENKFKPVQYNLYNNLRVGEKVYSISNPKGLQFVFSDGMINQYNKDYIQFSAPISSGSSGGALLDNQGYLLGIITSQMNPSVYQNINFALPNKYFLSKINNNVIANYKNLNWTKFIIDNADKEQFKIYTNYAFNKKDFVMLYKYLKQLTVRGDFPEESYSLLGYLALMAYDKTNTEEYLNDAVRWYNLSLSCNQDIEASLFALNYLYARNNSDELLKNAFIRLKKDYPASYYKLIELMTKTGNCAGNDKKCTRLVGIELMDYLGQITTFNPGAELNF